MYNFFVGIFNLFCQAPHLPMLFASMFLLGVNILSDSKCTFSYIHLEKPPYYSLVLYTRIIHYENHEPYHICT